MVESWRTNVLRMVMIFGIMVVWFVGSAYFTYRSWPVGSETDAMVSNSLNFFLAFGAICGLALASNTFDTLKTRSSRLSVLMTPATPFEKFFSRWMISTIVYIVVFIILFMLADYTRVFIYRFIYPDATIIPASLKYLVITGSEYSLSGSSMGYKILSYFSFQSFFLLGSVIWPKNSFIKTLTAGLFIMITYSLFAAGVARMLRGENIYINNSSFGDVSMDALKIINMVILVFFIFFNWVIAYYRFKESEIINRP
jgi:hypothetical protein